MATRRTPRKAASNSDRLVPALRDAVKVIDRALEALGGAPKKKRAARRKPREA